MGSSEDPLTPVPVFDTSPDQLATCGPAGILVQLPELIKNPPRVAVYRTINQTIPGGETAVPIEMNVADYDVGGWWDPDTDPGIVTVPVDGLYVINGLATMGLYDGSEPPNVNTLRVIKNLSSTLLEDVETSDVVGVGVRLSLTIWRELRAGDTLYLECQNNLTQDQTARPDAGNGNRHLGMEIKWEAPIAGS